MNENHDSFFDEEGIFESIHRFENMLNSNSSCFFDVYEFENIIDFYLDQHNFNNASAAIERGLKQHPYSVSLKFRLAQVYIQNGKPSKGLHFLREIEPMESANSEYFLIKGTALNILGKKEEAHRAFDRAIQLAYDNKDEIVFKIGFSYLNTRRYNLAIKYFSLAHEINPRNIAVINELALVYERVEKLEKSIEFYNKYLDIDPYDETIWFNLGMLYTSLEDFDRAISAYDFAIAISPDYLSAYFSKANIMVSKNDYLNAVQTYEEIIYLDPENVQAYTYIGECYEKMSFFKRSIYYYRKAITVDKDFGDAWFGLGMAYFSLNEYARGLENFIIAKSIDPENPEYWFMLGEVYKKLNILDKSAEAYNRAVDLDPNDYEAWLSFAEISFTENRLIDAISILSKAYQYNKDIASINYNLAAYYLYNNQPQQAYAFFEKALSINFKEHCDLLSRFPHVQKNKTISHLIRKYKNLS